MKKRLLRYLIPAILIVSLQAGPIGIVKTTAAQDIQSSNASETYPYVRVLETDSQGLTLLFTPPRPVPETITQGETTCQKMSIAGLAQAEVKDEPSLPVQGVMLGIPPDATVSFKVLAAEKIQLGKFPEPCFSDQPIIPEHSEKPTRVVSPSKGHSRVEQKSDPTKNVELVETGMLRSQHYAQFRFNPVTYDYANGEFHFYAMLKVRVDFNTPKGSDSLSGFFTPEPFFESQFQEVLINYEQAKSWRVKSNFSSDFQSALLSTGDYYKILIDEKGIYKLTPQALEDAGIDISGIDPSTLQVFYQGNEVAIRVETADPESFSPGDYLLFFGEALDSKYSDTNVYWLTWGLTEGLRMGQIPNESPLEAETPISFRTTEHFEEDFIYWGGTPSGPERDHWFWDDIFGPYSVDHVFDLPNLSLENHPAVLRGTIRSYDANPNHSTKIFLNGELLDLHTFAAGTEYRFEIPFDSSLLKRSDNQLTVECPLIGGIIDQEVFFNWFEVDYASRYSALNDSLVFAGDTTGVWNYVVDGFTTGSIEVYDITQPTAPKLVTGTEIEATSSSYQLSFTHSIVGEHRYLAQGVLLQRDPLQIIKDDPSNWKSSSNGADYIIISHPDFMDAMQTLASYREAQGYRVALVDVQDLYDEFTFGVFTPEAIRLFLSYAYANWISPAPAFVLLVGDGHYDYKNIYQYDEINFMPPYLDDVDPWAGETATDNRFVCVSGADILPDMYIGRFPVKTAAEALTMVNKIITYETQPRDTWNNRLTFVADNADIGGNFPVDSDRIADLVPSDYVVERIYYGITHDRFQVKPATISAINQGSFLLHYAGHGSIRDWAWDPNLLSASDIPSLSNGSKLPFVLPMTCDEGYFIYPSPSGTDNSSLGESIVRWQLGGAVGSWSPTGQGAHSGHMILSEDFVDNLLNENYTQVGYLTTHAKYHLFAVSSIYNDLIETYALFGDPALRLRGIPRPLESPNNLTALPFSKTHIHLQWNDNSSDETTFLIERSLTGLDGDWFRIGIVGENTTTYEDELVSPDTVYHYRVRAFRSQDAVFSGYSNIADIEINLLWYFLPLISN